MKHSPDKTYKLLKTDNDDDNDDDDEDEDDDNDDVMMIMINSSDYLNVFCNYSQIPIFCQSNFQPKVCNSYLIQCQAICSTSQYIA